MTKEYELSTIKDLILKIPPAKTECCLHELKTMILHAQSVILAAGLTNNDEIKQEIIKAIPDTFTWIDDSKNESTLNISVNGESLFSSIMKGVEE